MAPKLDETPVAGPDGPAAFPSDGVDVYTVYGHHQQGVPNLLHGLEMRNMQTYLDLGQCIGDYCSSSNDRCGRSRAHSVNPG